MAIYGTKEYWEDIRDRSVIVLDSLMSTSFCQSVPYKKAYDFCKAFIENYDEYVNAVEHIRELEATNVSDSNA